ncbi:MAG TPA: class I SAM-dependent methyltransferase, partial [Polyangiaceae bacterium]|nr:class I SAM-dependent methyltransferase [Polyangiaceae bacterium]
AGAGHNAVHLKARFRCTLTDLSERMLGLSRELNPECEHAVGDMRTLRLGRTFDAVLVHDAVTYMLTEDDLRAAAETAFVHTRPGGAAVFAPDEYKDTFCESSDLLSSARGARSLRGLEWKWDPDASDDTYVVDYAFLLREGDHVQSVHDRHVEGLFLKATWIRVLSAVGYRVEAAHRHDEGRVDDIFLCRRPVG